jgi:hypothetical protein
MKLGAGREIITAMQQHRGVAAVQQKACLALGWLEENNIMSQFDGAWCWARDHRGLAAAKKKRSSAKTRVLGDYGHRNCKC